jgi:sugar-specific transcriptional regulator TrmB
MREVRWQEFGLLDEAGLTTYETRALVTLMVFGVADAGTLCREGGIPTSKIYRAMEKLARLRLVEAQPTRPKLFAALSAEAVTDRLTELAREKAERFASRARDLQRTLAELPRRLQGRRTFVDLALGVESHVKRHLIHLAGASRSIVSYLEHGDLTAIDRAVDGGFPILRRVARNAAERGIDHRIVFGFSYHTAPRLLAFLRRHGEDLGHATGVRYAGELGHPFHVVDAEMVILSLDHPFVPDGRVASLLVHDAELAQRLSDGFEQLWTRAMRNLREISFHPAGLGGPTA